MKKKKKILIPCISGSVLFVIILLLFLSMMPFRGQEKECDTSSGGRSIAINGHIMWYKICNPYGKGIPVYVLAGGPGFSSDYMEEYMSFLEEDHPVIFYDGRCSGRSEYHEDLSDCTYENYAKDLEVLRERLTPDKKIILMAHSSGGITAMSYLKEYEEQLAGVVFISSAGCRTKVFYSDQYLHTGFPPFNQRYANAWFVLNIKELYDDYIVNKDILGILDNCKINYALMMKNEGRDKYDYEKELRKSDVPALILHGGEMETPITGIAEAEELHDLLGNSEIYEFENSGHFCFAEEPEVFQAKVEEFLGRIKDK